MKLNLLSILLLITHIISSQNNLHNRKKNTLVEFSEIINHYNSYGDSDNSNIAKINIYSSTYGYLLLVKNTEKYRNISSEKMNLLRGVFKSIKPELKIEELFEKEVLINTNSGKFWIPIQKSLFNFWINELKKDDFTLVYIRTFGSTDDIDENKWLFTINSFNSDYYDGLWEQAINSFKSNDETNGLRCLNKMIELNPKDARNYSMYGYYYYNNGYPDKRPLLIKSDSLYAIAEKLSPNYSYGYYQRALTKIQLGEYKAAWDAIEKSKNLGETNIEEFILERLESKLPYTEYLKMKN